MVMITKNRITEKSSDKTVYSIMGGCEWLITVFDDYQNHKL